MRTERLLAGLFVSSSVVFVLSGLVSVWASADRAQSLARFWLLALGLLFGYVMWWAGGRVSDAPGRAGLAAALLGGAGGVLYVATRFSGSEGIAGALIVLIPLGVAGIAWSRHVGMRATLIGALAAISVALLALALTAERTAWLGLAAGALVGTAFTWRFGHGRTSPLRHVADVSAAAVVALSLLAAVALVRNANLLALLAETAGASDYGRLRIWQDGLQLVEDYRYTGIGLGQSGMVLSTYVYLFHVPFLYQTYNLFLQVAVEQGAPGLIGLSGVLIAGFGRAFLALRSDRQLDRWYAGSVLAALMAVCVHGLFDAGLYVAYLSPVLFLPIGFAMSLQSQSSSGDRADAGTGLSFTWNVVGGLAPVLAMALVLAWPGTRGAMLANRAAVEQTRIELGTYRWPEWYVQDDVRRSNAVDLSGAVAGYEAALARDAENSTAHRRLGQIAMSMGDKESARQHLEAAYTLSPQQRTTRQLLGEAYAVSGEVDQAVRIWASGVTDPHKLELRQAWYRESGKEQEAEWLNEAVWRYQSVRQQQR